MYGGFNQIGRTAILNMEATTNQAISALISNNNVNTKFLQSYLNFNVNKWKRYAASSRKDPNITKKDIENFIVPFTNIIEQNKIGDFFSKLDRQIELEEEKLGLLQQYKKSIPINFFLKKYVLKIIMDIIILIGMKKNLVI